MPGFGNETCGVIDSSILIEDKAYFRRIRLRVLQQSFWYSSSKCCMMTVVPNLVYEVIIRAPSVIVTFEELVKPVANNLSNELIYKAPWNHDTRIICHPYDRASCSSEKDLKERPSLPKIRRHGEILYSLENNEVIWPKDPKYREGHAVQADMYYCKYNQFYVVYRYFVLKAKNIPPLKTRRSMESHEFGGHMEYYVKLKRSSRLGFFVCKELDYCLVEDSKRLLMNAASDSKRKFFPAWLKRSDPSRLARFEVSALDHQHYNPTELWSAAPDVKSTGFLINQATGSEKIPKLVIWFAFEAVYSAQNAYVVLRLSPIESKSAISAIPWRGGYLFEETLNCTGIRMSEKVYAAQNFGLVMDPENMIMDKAKKNRIELPQSISRSLGRR
uniref:Uncharacterized protein n=1 Tax=Ditylenchus dipsaci TaxID=166011 RepID=A0A915DS55_9BILA